MPELIHIDRMDKHQQALLNQVIRQNLQTPDDPDPNKARVLKPEQVYRVRDPANNQEREVTLSDFVIARQTTRRRPGLRCEVFSKDEHLGSGGFGAVYATKGNLLFKNDKAVYRPPSAAEKNSPHERIVKILTCTREEDESDESYQERVMNFRKDVEKEYAMSKIAGHFRSKAMIEDVDENGNATFYLFSERFRETTLSKIINNDINYFEQLELEPRIALAEALLVALKTQIHDKGLIHRDIKPDNILVNMSDPLHPIVNIIDLNLTVEKANDDKGIGFGTLAYMAPEVFEKGIYQESDTFSMGLCLALLFRSRIPMITRDNPYDPYFEFNNLLDGIKGLDEDDAASIRNLLGAMYLEDPNERPPLEAGIEFFREVKAKLPAFENEGPQVGVQDEQSSSLDSNLIENERNIRVSTSGSEGLLTKAGMWRADEENLSPLGSPGRRSKIKREAYSPKSPKRQVK